MKYALIVGAAGLAAPSLAACNKPASTTASDATQSAASAVDKAQDTTGAAVGQASAALAPHDTGAFVSNLTQAGMYEIEAGKIAQAKSKNPEVKAFAKMMVADHTAMDKAMAPLIKAAGQTPADKLDQRRQGFIDNLNSATPADFDKVYIDQQVAGHQEALDLVDGYARDGSDAGLKGGAADAGPKVQAHLDKAKAIQAKLSSSTK